MIEHQRKPIANNWPILTIVVTFILGGCSSSPINTSGDGIDYRLPPPQDIASIQDASPREEPMSAYGNPDSYVVFGERYRPLKESRGYTEKGIASWYGSKFHGRRTSSGEAYDMYAMTAAHKTLPLPSYARVTNLKNDRSVIVKVNDRGPFHDNRLIDLSYTAAWKLGIIGEGTGLVEVTAIDPSAPTPPPEVPEVSNGPDVPDASDMPDAPVQPKQPHGLPALFLQVGAFGNAQNADRLRQRIREQLQVSVLIEESQSDEKPLYRVQIGPIASVELADHLSLQLDEMGIRNPHVVIR